MRVFHDSIPLIRSWKVVIKLLCLFEEYLLIARLTLEECKKNLAGITSALVTRGMGSGPRVTVPRVALVLLAKLSSQLFTDDFSLQIAKIPLHSLAQEDQSSTIASASISTNQLASMNRTTCMIVLAGRIFVKNSPCTRATFSQSSIRVKRILVRITSDSLPT